MTAEPLWDLYWLGFILSGDRELTLQTMIEAVELKDAANPFFASWFVQWSRKVFIAKVLGRVPREASAQELRTRLQRLEAEAGRGRIAPASPTMDKADLERALLSIDSLPRRALILTVFERLSLEDAGILLNADRESVKTAAAIGLIELSRNLSANRIPRNACALQRVSPEIVGAMP
jgi:DNA-directed RNA polymerase specialized sigma24 family protein